MHAVAGQPSHDSCLLVVAHALLKEVGLAPAGRSCSASDPYLNACLPRLAMTIKTQRSNIPSLLASLAHRRSTMWQLH